jgi:hypothetical protein
MPRLDGREDLLPMSCMRHKRTNKIPQQLYSLFITKDVINKLDVPASALPTPLSIARSNRGRVARWSPTNCHMPDQLRSFDDIASGTTWRWYYLMLVLETGSQVCMRKRQAFALVPVGTGTGTGNLVLES